MFVGTTIGYATLHPPVARIAEGRLTFLGAGGWRVASLALSAMALATGWPSPHSHPAERPGREAPESLIKAIAAMLTVAFKSPFGRLMMAIQPAVLGAIALYKAGSRTDSHAGRFLDRVGPTAFAASTSAVLALVLVKHPYAWGGLHSITDVLVEAASTGVTVHASVALTAADERWLGAATRDARARTHDLDRHRGDLGVAQGTDCGLQPWKGGESRASEAHKLRDAQPASAEPDRPLSAHWQ